METISDKWHGIGSMTFKRNQIEWALWRVFRRFGDQTKDPSSRFTTRIKRLLDLDRRRDNPAGTDDPKFLRYAYLEDEPKGKGSETEFRAADAFCIAIGLELLDVGLNQWDAVFLGRGTRQQLIAVFNQMLSEPAIRDQRGLLSSDDFPNLPWLAGKAGRIADLSVFLVIRRAEITLLEKLQLTRSPDMPAFLEPKIFFGTQDIARWLSELRLKDRKAIVLEIGFSATRLCKSLASAPVARRGRPRIRRFPKLKPKRRF